MELLLTIHTSLQRYIIVHRPEYELRRVMIGDDLDRVDARGRPLICAELGALLLRQQHGNSRQSAIVVPLRRQSVALLCEAVDDLRVAEAHALRPLPPLLQQHTNGWINAVYMPEDEPMLVLDLRTIAMHVVRQTSRAQQGDSV